MCTLLNFPLSIFPRHKSPQIPENHIVFHSILLGAWFRNFRKLLCKPTLIAYRFFFLNSHSGGWSPNESTGTSATEWPIVPAPGDYDDAEFGGIKIDRGNRSTRRKPAPAPLCPPQIPLDQTWAQTRAAAVGSQRLTAWAMERTAYRL
jgi:hypothetical protein